MKNYTDKDLNIIDSKVYDIGKHNWYKVGAEVNHKYRVISRENNSTNGMQAYAVAPINKNGQVDYNNVVISYAGTDSGDMKDILTDIETVGLGSKVLFEPKLSSLGPVPEIKGESQSVSADKFYQRVNKQIKQHGGVKAPTTSGHSLGGTLAMYVAAKHHLSATTFNGPDAWSMLTKKEREYVKTHPMDFMNYRNPKDIIGNITGNSTGSAKYVKSKTYFGSELVKQLEDVNDKLLNGSLKDKALSSLASLFTLDIATGKTALDYHSIDGWKFDKDGNILRVSGKTVNSKTNREFVKKYQQTRQQLLTSEAKLNAYYGSGKGISSAKVIMLEAAAAYGIKNAIISHADEGLMAINQIYNEGKEKQEHIWPAAKSSAYSVGKDLTPGECIEALSAGGATRETLVTNYVELLNDKQSQISGIKANFDSFGSTFSARIEGKLSQDRELAGQFGITVK